MERICDIDYCDRPAERQRKKCIGHRRRLATTGTYGTEPIKRVPPANSGPEGVLRFNGWDVTEEGCWEYRGPRFANGYGQVKVDGTPQLAHRLSYQLWVGEIPDGAVVRHKCDNKPCLNPDHLETGTQFENVQDRNERGRTARGNQGVGKFTDDQVRAIRAEVAGANKKYGDRGRKYQEIAEREEVSYGCIQGIWLRNTYKHVE
jgi:hypothetical protein